MSPVVHIPNENSSCSLEYYLCHNGLQSGMTLLLSSSLNHTISNSKFCLSENLSNVTIKSDSSINSAFITCNKTWTGFGFYNTSNLTFIDLVFHQCGGEIQPSDRFTNESNFYFGPYQKAVLLFSHCMNTHLESVSIMGPYGGFGIVAVNALGNSTLININVTDNHPCTYTDGINGWFNFSCSGSGIVFLYIETQFSNVFEMPVIIGWHLFLSRNFNIYNFEENLINLIGPTQPQRPLISATGLTIILASNQHQVVGIFRNIEISQTLGTHTGGMLIIYHNTSLQHQLQMNSLLIANNSNRMHNLIKRVSPGISIFLFLDHQQLVHSQHIWIINSVCKHNRGVIGVCIYVATQSLSTYKLFIDVETTTFIGNEASIQGSCMYVEPITTVTKYLSSGFHSIRLAYVYASNNGHQHRHDATYDYSTFEVSVFAFVNLHYIVVHSCNFSSNIGSALQISGSGLQIKGNFYCENNIANMGACIFLKGLSRLLLENTFTGSFINNKALTSGGAIYADNNDIFTKMCTIQLLRDYHNTTYQLTFINNTAYLDGDAIKIANLYNCFIYSSMDNIIIPPSQLPELYNTIFYITPKQRSSISSVATHFNCCNDSLHTYECPSFKFYPGQRLLIPVIAADAVNSSVYTNVAMTYINDDHTKTQTWKIGGINRLYAKKCNKLNFTILTTVGSNPLNGKLKLYSKNAIKTFKLMAMPCPFGFIAVNGKCDCSSFLYSLNKNISCDIQTVTISLPYSSWFGNISSLLSNNTQSVEGFSSVCPSEYCYPSLTTYNATMLNPLCQYGRTGIICGQCNDNLSLVFGSDECQECSNLWLLSILGYALLLVLLLFILNLTVSNGTLGGLVFFANMSVVSLHTNLLVDKLYTLPVKLSLSFLNLNLGYPMCFYHGMDIVVKTGLQFVFPVYLWSLVLGLVIISRYSTRISNLIVGSSVQVLATLIQLSFAKLLLTVSDIFTSAEVHTTHHHPLMVWYFGGNITYLSGGHLVLFLLSLLTALLFLLPYLVITTIASHLRKYRLSKHIRPLIDAYHGPYKDRLGYWFGVRQWLVVFLYIVYASLRGVHPLIMLIIHIVIVAIFMIVQNHVKPFKNTLVNLLDTWFVFLLFVTNIATFALIFLDGLRSGNVFAFLILVLYLLSVIGVVLYHCIIAIRCLRQVMLNCFSKIQKMQHKRETTHRDLEYDDDCGFREPLLDSARYN